MSTYDADSAACPEDLERKEGATMTCEMTTGEETVELDVSVIGLTGDFVDYSKVPVE